MSAMTIDHDFHDGIFYLDDLRELHAVGGDGKKVSLPIIEQVADEFFEDQPSYLSRYMVFITSEGRWALVGEAGGTVDLFDSRAELGQHLWENVAEQGTFLFILRSLGMLRLDATAPHPVDLGNGGGLAGGS